MPPNGKVTPPSPSCGESARPRGLRERIRTAIACYRRDVTSVLEHDPAARTALEVVLTYPGVHALWIHRAAHRLWKSDLKLSARVLSHLSRFATGVEIHPGATIGQGVFIDHGMGVVIGETATIGDDCILYKGAVLGGTRTERTQRHPQLGKHVVVGSNACILGNITVGDGARIGSGSVVVRDVPPEATVVGVPGRVIPKSDDRKARFEAVLDHASLPDPTAEMLRALREDNERLRARLDRLERALNLSPEELETNEESLLDGRLATTDLPPSPPQHGG